MTHGAQSVLDAFEQLPPSERDEVVRELLRRTASSTHESPSDDELIEAADVVFLELDEHELCRAEPWLRSVADRNDGLSVTR